MDLPQDVATGRLEHDEVQLEDCPWLTAPPACPSAPAWGRWPRPRGRRRAPLEQRGRVQRGHVVRDHWREIPRHRLRRRSEGGPAERASAPGLA
eukprot:2981807-Pyramimonas_sp.AAC.1